MPPPEVDVLIAGSGSAGLAAATWLSLYNIPASRIAILDKRPTPMAIGQADGVQCRTVEIFESFGLSEALLKESYHVLEVAFWRDEGDGKGLVRRRRTGDTERGLSWCPHVILNQARINGLMLEKMAEGGLGVEYGWDVKGVEMEDGGQWARVMAEEVGSGEKREWRAKYVLACDGAHSNVRRSLGYKMLGDSSDAVWGVMDVYARTNFPDLRKKAALHSEDGALLIIPREGGSLVRFYIELPEGTNAKDVKFEDLEKAAKKMFGKYDLEIAETFWWSAYSIGQRLADHFSKDNRIFLTGDACHTHSPKAGQGMNVSLQDGYNIGWKLGMVLTGLADESLLKTYDIERGRVAKELIDFDRRWTKTFSPRHAKEVGGGDPEFFANEFIKAGRYTAGLTARYVDTVITDDQNSKSDLASNVTVGMRCPSAQVVRFCDAKAMQLAQAMRSDGRFRILIFAGDIAQKDKEERLTKLSCLSSRILGQYLDSHQGPIRSLTSVNAPLDSVIESIVVLSGDRGQIEQEQIHPIFSPVNGKWLIPDLHKSFVDEESYNSGHGRCYEHFGIDPNEGAVLIVRPDNYVSKLTTLDDHDDIGSFFTSFIKKPAQTNGTLLAK